MRMALCVLCRSSRAESQMATGAHYAKGAILAMSQALRRRMTMSRQILNRAARARTLGSLTPFVHPVLTGVPTPMPKPSLKLASSPAPFLTKKVLPAPVPIVSKQLTVLLDERLELAAKIDQLTAKKKAIDAELLKQTVTRSGDPDGAIDTDEYTVRAVNAENSHVSRELLLKAGVKPSMIAKCTKKTKYAYALVTKKKPTVSLEDALK